VDTFAPCMLIYSWRTPWLQAIYPTEYEGVKVVSFGFAGQGSAIMRGPMVSGLIQQMLTTAEWGEWSEAAGGW
jgi:Mrp family chromosome partitioning ATPase